ncbi:MAG: Rpn family recombination-promoting nuclease/putative transposase [Treponema sp.]|nr:Rpn family recombination-promoting nuclease/putative transposase [Treponema sp.]
MNEIQKEQTLEEKWENATIANNFIFYKVMRNNPDVCQELLEILLEFKIERIEMSQEEEINVDFGSKGIRMDVYAKDSDGQKAYNIELQAKDTKELPERARYYQGVMDVDLLKSGQDYKNLNTTFIVFICVDDIFEKGLAKYTFENLCVEDPKIKMGDRAYKYFFISQNCDKLLDEEQKAFLKMVSNNKSSNAFTDKVKKLVDNAKRNTQWRKQFMDWEREKTYSFNRGLEQGAQQKAVETARNLLNEGVAPEVISRCVGLPLEQVLDLQKQALHPR